MALHTMAHVSGDDVLSTVHPFPILTMALYLLQVIEKTKGLSFRSYVLAQNIEKRNLQASA